MNSSEIASTVHFASDVFQGKTLSDAIQRELNASRSAKDIAFYWRENEARFFNSIVIAAWQGAAKFNPIETLESGESFLDDLINSDGRMKDSFGILKFDGTETYYALDGQHRVKAIQLMHDDPASYPPPEGFSEDEFTVIIVPTAEGETVEEFRIRYRRMFSALNRYAKPTDGATNVVMDEDDIFAIVTRRLITDHPFFSWGENDWESERVKTTSGKNLASGNTWFTQIEVLYKLTETLLTSALRQNGLLSNSNIFVQVRPSDSLIEAWYQEVALIWDVLVEIIPRLNDEPAAMRTHNPTAGDADKADHLWFWTIGIEMVSLIVRMLIDASAVDPDSADDSPLERHRLEEALAVLSHVDWDLHSLPWRHLVLVSSEDVWRMRSEGRKEALKVAKQILMWIVGLIEYSEQGVADLRDVWQFNLYQPDGSPESFDEMWQTIVDLKMLAEGGHL